MYHEKISEVVTLHFVFNPQMGELPKKRKIYIEEAKVTEAVKNAISLEMDMAEKMKAYLQTEKMQQLLQKETQQYSEKAWMIFQEMEQVEKDRIPLYEKIPGTMRLVRQNIRRKKKKYRRSCKCMKTILKD